MTDIEEKVYCQSCERKTNHCSILHYQESDTEPNEFHWSSTYHIAKCKGCDNVAFVRAYWDEGQFEYESGNPEPYAVFTVYPEEPKDRHLSSHLMRVEAKEFTSLPEFIFGLYFQTIEAYNANSHILAALGLRTILEAICKEAGVVDGVDYDSSSNVKEDGTGKPKRTQSLMGKINGLVEKGLITKKQSDVLHQVRELGNYAAHEIQTPKRKALRDGISLIETLLHQLYELENIEISPKK